MEVAQCASFRRGQSRKVGRKLFAGTDPLKVALAKVPIAIWIGRK